MQFLSQFWGFRLVLGANLTQFFCKKNQVAKFDIFKVKFKKKLGRENVQLIYNDFFSF
jgi:hypothetical protein